MTLLFGLALSACASSGGGAGGPGGPGVTLPDIDGREVKLGAERDGELFVLIFWATWCQPCRSELAKLSTAYLDYEDRGLRLYAISIDGPGTVAQVPSWVRRERYSFPVLLDRETEVLGRYHPGGDIPFYVVLDGDGRVLERHQGYVDGDVEALLRYLDARLPIGQTGLR